jgi:hypothetical protein
MVLPAFWRALIAAWKPEVSLVFTSHPGKQQDQYKRRKKKKVFIEITTYTDIII